MTDQEQTRALIHYTCTHEQLRRDNIATALMKSVFSKKEYNNRSIMVVSAIPKSLVGNCYQASTVSFLHSLVLRRWTNKIRMLVKMMWTRLY